MGLHSHVDSIYIPLDTKTGVGKGYAFVHFTDEASAVEFMSKANGKRLPRSNNPKTMQVTYAVRHAIAHIPKKRMSKCTVSDRTPTAFLWLR
jgi:RNA recognition motif-containing protein